MQGPLIASRVRVKGHLDFFSSKCLSGLHPSSSGRYSSCLKSFWRIECCACTSNRNPRWPDRDFGAKSSVTRRSQGLKREDYEKSWGIVGPGMNPSHGTAQLRLFVYLREAVTMAARDLSRDSSEAPVLASVDLRGGVTGP
jgi:hypothetical protein